MMMSMGYELLEMGSALLLAFIMVGIGFLIFLIYIVIDTKWKISEKLSNIPIIFVIMGVLITFYTILVMGHLFGWWIVEIG